MKDDDKTVVEGNKAVVVSPELVASSTAMTNGEWRSVFFLYDIVYSNSSQSPIGFNKLPTSSNLSAAPPRRSWPPTAPTKVVRYPHYFLHGFSKGATTGMLELNGWMRGKMTER